MRTGAITTGAEKTVEAGLTTILCSTSPIFTFLITFAITRHEPATLTKLFGVIVGIAGICLIVGVEALSGLGNALVAKFAIIAALIGMSVFSTTFAFALYFRLVRTLGSVGVTAQAYLRVPIGVAFGVAFLGESLAPSALIGLACVVAGVAMMVPAKT